MFFKQIFSRVRAGFVLGALPLTLMAVLPTSAKAANLNFDQIYAFGDSLSDDGNTFKFTGNQFPPPPYFNGRFSNGPVWVEQLATSLGLKLTSLAFGGASTGTDNTLNSVLLPNLPPLLPGLQQEINAFTAPLIANKSADPNALYIVWAGANDYLPTISNFKPFQKPDTPIANLLQAVTLLNKAGGKNIMVVDLPDLGKLPGTNNLGEGSIGLNILTDLHNFTLAASLKGLSQTLDSDVNLTFFDVNSLFKQVIADPKAFGLADVTRACLVNLVSCNNPDDYFFWDDLHPTTKADTIIAKAAISTLSVPEPSANLGILAFGLVGAVSMLKRKQKKQVL